MALENSKDIALRDYDNGFSVAFPENVSQQKRKDILGRLLCTS